LSALLVAVLAALALGEPAAPPAPSPGALKRAAEAAGRAWVRVLGTGSAPGVLVGADGQVLTLTALVHGSVALVELGDARRTARVVERLPSLGLVLLTIDGDGPFPAPAARLDAPASGEWVVGLGDDGRSPRLGRVTKPAAGPWFEVSLSLPPGSPVLDGQARLVGVVTARRASSSRVATLGSVRILLGQAP
jgi:hypothetical protein